MAGIRRLFTSAPQIRQMDEMRRCLRFGLWLTVWGCASHDSLAEILARLGDPQEQVRHDAVWELKDASDPRAAQGLMRALTDSSPEVRGSAAMVIEESQFEGPEMVQALTRASRDPNPQVREWAVIALGRISDPAALPALHQAKDDRAEEVRGDAIAAIRRIDFALQAREIRYHPPAAVPIAFSQGDRESFLRAHEAEWMFAVSQVTDEDLAAPKLGGSIHTICERSAAETTGGYLGQEDGWGFLEAVHRRIRREPRVLEEFRALREQALKRFPPPKKSEDDQ